MITDKATQEKLYKKILARNTRYDDIFFFAVTSTGIYCRPSCPARRPLMKNCQFFTSSPEAEKAGFRACKRCRPDQAKPDTVILRLYKTQPYVLIGENAREAIGIDIGERQVRRLVKNNIGKTPVQIFQQQRLKYAYDLLQNTHLSIINIAFRAEFGSIRQFNHAFRQRYGTSPRQSRRSREDDDKHAL